MIFVPCRSTLSKAYLLILGDDVFDISFKMTVALSENDACKVGRWTLVMKIDGKEVYTLPTLPVSHFKSRN